MLKLESRINHYSQLSKDWLLRDYLLIDSQRDPLELIACVRTDMDLLSVGFCPTAPSTSENAILVCMCVYVDVCEYECVYVCVWLSMLRIHLWESVRFESTKHKLLKYPNKQKPYKHSHMKRKKLISATQS